MQLIPGYRKIIIAICPVRMFDNFRRFGRICSVISVGSVRFGSVTGFIHSRVGFVVRNKSRILSCLVGEVTI